MESPRKNPTVQLAITTRDLFLLSWGHSSRMAVMTVSVMVNCESKPSRMSMKKNIKEKIWDPGILATASG